MPDLSREDGYDAPIASYPCFFVCKRSEISCTRKRIPQGFFSQHPASRQALYPVSLEEGQEIPVKYPERFPALAVLDPDGLKRVWYTENKKSKIPVIMISMTITALYVIAIVLI